MAVKEGALIPHYDESDGDDTVSNDVYSTTTDVNDDDDVLLHESNTDILSNCSTSTSADSLYADQDGLCQYQDTSSSDLIGNSNVGEIRQNVGEIRQNVGVCRQCRASKRTSNDNSPLYYSNVGEIRQNVGVCRQCRASKRTSNDNIPLSRAALSLLHRASHRVGAAAPPTTQRWIDITSAVGDETYQRLNAALYRELGSLRQQIPSFKKRAAKSSCVITETLDYLDSLRKNIRDLENFIAAQPIRSDATHTANDVELQLRTLDDGDMKILVSCRKRPGLMGDIVMALESLDLVLDSMNVSCQGSRFIFQAVATNDEICSMMIGEENVRRAILNAISNSSNIH